MRLTLALVLALLALTASTRAGGFGRRGSAFFCSPQVALVPQSNYVAPRAAYAQPQVQILQQLVGIPVPTTYAAPIAEQGTTVYGYPYGLSQQIDQSIDYSALLSQSSRLVSQAQQLAGQTSADFTAQVQTVLDAQAKVAAASVFAQGFTEALKAASSDAAPATFSFHVSQNANGGLSVEMDQPEASTTLEALIQSKCSNCHDGENQPLVSELPLPTILRRLYTDDAEKRMPKGGQPLTDSEISLFLQRNDR